MRLSRLHCAAGAAFLACAMPALVKAVVFDAASDFSPSSNPNGVWSFGSQTTLGSGFTVLSIAGSSSGIDFWQTSTSYPSALHNSAATTFIGGTVEIDAGQLVLHPGPSGEFALARFTVPTSGTYTFSAAFIGQDFIYPTTTDVHLLVNGVSQFSGLVSTFHGITPSGTFTMPLTAGDTIDAAVGYGVNGNYLGDTTGLSFLVETVPTPGAAVLLGMGGLLAARRRR